MNYIGIFGFLNKLKEGEELPHLATLQLNPKSSPNAYEMKHFFALDTNLYQSYNHSSVRFHKEYFIPSLDNRIRTLKDGKIIGEVPIIENFSARVEQITDMPNFYLYNFKFENDIAWMIIKNYKEQAYEFIKYDIKNKVQLGCKKLYKNLEKGIPTIADFNYDYIAYTDKKTLHVQKIF